MTSVLCRDDNKIDRTYWCAVCIEVHNEQGYTGDDEISEGGLKSNDPELWDSYRKDNEE